MSIVLAVIAVVAGFLILRNITDDGGSSSSTDSGSAQPAEPETPTTDDTSDGSTTTTEPTPSTTAPLVTDGASVMVANANGIGGSAGRMSDRLANWEFTMAESGNATVQLEDSVVQFDGSVASARKVARSVAQVLGGVKVEKLPTPPQVDGGDLGGAGVLVLLGANEADKTPKQLQRAAAKEANTGTAPEPAGTTASDG